VPFAGDTVRAWTEVLDKAETAASGRRRVAAAAGRRITGNALLVGAFLLVWWLIAAASGAAYFATVDAILTSVIGDLVMVGSLWALWYHTLGGVRHLIWDTGRALDVATADRLGWGIILGSVVMTVLTLLVIM
jgi:succinate dehydrogenase / fumarate reductase cytochrome b subunit